MIRRLSHARGKGLLVTLICLLFIAMMLGGCSYGPSSGSMPTPTPIAIQPTPVCNYTVIQFMPVYNYTEIQPAPIDYYTVIQPIPAYNYTIVQPIPAYNYTAIQPIPAYNYTVVQPIPVYNYTVVQPTPVYNYTPMPTSEPTPTAVPFLRSPVGYPESMKLYITPDDPAIQAAVDDILNEPWTWGYSDFEALRTWVADHITYIHDIDVYGQRDYWQLPSETLDLRTGDCEDFAILFCTLLRAYGVPADQVYVAVGGLSANQYSHAYLVERWTTGEWRVLEPQESTWWVLLFGDSVSFWLDYEIGFCFNDESYLTEAPTHEFPRYMVTGWPGLYSGIVYLSQYLESGEIVSGSVIEIPPGDTSIWKDWGIKVLDPQGNIIINKGGSELHYDFSFWAEQSGFYQIEIWNSGYSKIVELQVEPSGWEFVSGEWGSREAH